MVDLWRFHLKPEIEIIVQKMLEYQTLQGNMFRFWRGIN